MCPEKRAWHLPLCPFPTQGRGSQGSPAQWLWVCTSPPGGGLDSQFLPGGSWSSSSLSASPLWCGSVTLEHHQAGVRVGNSDSDGACG
jgi:hypothetical protein